MARIKKKRDKQHKPRPVSPVGGLGLIAAMHAQASGQQPIIGADRTDLSVAYWLAFDAMTRGQSNEENWSIVTVSLNVSLILSEQGFGNEYEPYIIKALEGAFRAKVRAGRTGSWRYDGDAINAIREAFEIHDEQIKIATKDEMRSALNEVYRRINEGFVYQEAA
jgi:hypothetical protein